MQIPARKNHAAKAWRIFILLFVMLCLIINSVACQNDTDVIRPSEAPSKVVKESKSTTELPDPWGSVSRVVELIQADDTVRLLDHIYPLAIEKYGQEQIVDRNANIHADLGVKSIKYSNISSLNRSENGRQVYYTALAEYSTKYGEIKDEVTLSFIWHPAANAWQLDWTPAVILPGLNETGQVRVEYLPASRGDIYDRQGYPLAIDDTVAGVSIIPGEFDMERIDEVNELLGLSEGSIEAKLKQEWVRDDVLVPIALLPDLRSVDYKVFKELHLEWTELPSRSYPFGDCVAGLIGYVGQPSEEDLGKEENSDLREDNLIGRAGLEAIYDDRLRGKNGFRIFISGNYEHSLIEHPVQDGEDIYLTLDIVAQRAIFEELRPYNATATAIDPFTGEILALVSTPSYNPMEFVMGISQESYDALLANPRNPLDNKFASNLTPGSTQKIPTAMVAINNGSDDGYRTRTIEGKTWQPDDSWGNYFVTRYQEVDRDFNLADAISFSDNIYFAQTALMMGAEAFNDGLEKLGVGQAITPDYPFPIAQICNAGRIAEEESILLADSSYGQGELLFPPVHLASIYSAVVNGGMQAPVTLDLASPHRKNGAKPLIDADYASYLANALARVVDEQYRREMTSESVQLSGKSGTAEVGFDALGEVRLNNWFIGYERENPNLLLSLTLFDSQEEEDLFAMKLFRYLMETLYRNKPYKAPKASPGKVKDLDKLPAFVPMEHDPEVTPEDMEEESEVETDEEGNPIESEMTETDEAGNLIEPIELETDEAGNLLDPQA